MLTEIVMEIMKINIYDVLKEKCDVYDEPKDSVIRNL